MRRQKKVDSLREFIGMSINHELFMPGVKESHSLYVNICM